MYDRHVYNRHVYRDRFIPLLRSLPMAKIKVEWYGKNEGCDVRAIICKYLPCLHVDQNKGTFVKGRGYTSYYKDLHLVCWNRHMNGCPSIENRPKPVFKCCEHPDIPVLRKNLKRPPWKQRCRNCKKLLTRMEIGIMNGTFIEK